MLLSMTGHGQATKRLRDAIIDVEIRTVNNRFLKVVSKLSDCVSALEPQLEGLVRDHLKRGSVNLLVRVQIGSQSNAGAINANSLRDYIKQSQNIASEIEVPIAINLGELLMLPGVLELSDQRADPALLTLAREAVIDSLKSLNLMRKQEGDSMSKQLLESVDRVEAARKKISERAPKVIADYRVRLETKVRSGLADAKLGVSDLDLIREVMVHSDRCDVNEELVRLASHLEQFKSAILESESQGRKLDFLIQELFRETNTIGSKANDGEMSGLVVEIKTIIEQMRELVQNVE